MAAALAVGVLCLPATASAGLFKGTSSQDREAIVVTGKDGKVKRFSIRWNARCTKGFILRRQQTSFFQPMDKSSKRRFQDAGPPFYFVRFKNTPYLGRFNVSGYGRRDGKFWLGRFSARVRLTNVATGKRVTFCELETRWQVIQR